ncbi:tyrosine-type recombinase/integrase, partial [Bacteroides ovatus]|uniref:tyrosine-type recombinase/integrase n=1 Tax=Bacteroides ovatus TaxID=28116 RepID=UPI001E471CBC
WQNPEQLFVAQELINKVKSKCCGIKDNNLKDLARTLHLQSPVTSYTLRHSWATTAKYRGVSIEMISESLGHKSIKTTQIYLKGFELKERTEVNKGNLSYVRNCCVGRNESVKF